MGSENMPNEGDVNEMANNNSRSLNQMIERVITNVYVALM